VPLISGLLGPLLAAEVLGKLADCEITDKDIVLIGSEMLDGALEEGEALLEGCAALILIVLL
jgi:hypothetical protein